MKLMDLVSIGRLMVAVFASVVCSTLPRMQPDARADSQGTWSRAPNPTGEGILLHDTTLERMVWIGAPRVAANLEVWTQQLQGSGTWTPLMVSGAPSARWTFGEVVDVPGVEARASWLGGAMPNPTRSRATFDLTLDRESITSARMFDVSGRHLRTLLEGALAPGHHELRWDRRDDRGVLAPPGVYLLRVDAGGRSMTRRVVAID